MKKRPFILLLTGIIAIIGTLLYIQYAGSRAIKHIVILGSDGFSAEVIRQNKGTFPNIEALMQQGAYTLQRRTVLPSSSACNWSSMMMGASPELHGYTTWGSAKPDLPSREIGQYGRFPGIFGLIREQMPEAVIGFFYNWKTMRCLFDEGSENMKKQGTDAEIMEAALQFFTEQKPTFTFIALHDPDSTGHSKGWSTPEYIKTCKETDEYVGQFMEAIKNSPMADSTCFIFTSDHGGLNKGHGGKTLSEMESPLVIAGPGIRKNYEIQESTMVYDTAAIVADLLHLKQPQVWIGRPVKSIREK